MPKDEEVESVVHLAVELDQVAGNGVDELFVRGGKGEGFGYRPAVDGADGAHKFIEVGQLQKTLEVAVAVFIGLLPLLQLKHVFDVIGVGQRTQFLELAFLADVAAEILNVVEFSPSHEICQF